MKMKLIGLLTLMLGVLSSPAQAVTWTWNIDKSADQTDLTLAQAQTFYVNYTISLTAVAVDSDGTIDECINAADSLAGVLGLFCASDQPVTISYAREIGPFFTDGFYSVVNTATFTTNDTGTTGSDSWTVRVRVGDPMPVPEPGSIALFVSGLAVLGLTRRRKAS